MISNQIKAMYEDRLLRGEINQMISNKTIEKHNNNISILDRHLGKSISDSIEEMEWIDLPFSNINASILSMKNKQGKQMSLSTQHSYISSFIVALRCKYLEDYYQKQSFEQAKKHIAKDSDFTKSLKTYKEGASTRDGQTAPKRNDVEQAMNEYFQDSMETLDNKLILSIYKNHPFRLEVADLIYIDPRNYNLMKKKGELTNNYLVKSKGRGRTMFFSFSDYKTNGTYGLREIDVSDKFLKELMYEKLIPMKTGSRVFGTMSRNNLTKRITYLFEKKGMKKITPTTLSKLIISGQFKGNDAQKIIMNQKKLAQERGHSIDTQQQTYVSK